MKSKKFTVIGNIPWKVVKKFDFYLSFPLEDIFNRYITYGEYPEIWNLEIVTPTPKSFPPANEDQLRKLSCKKSFQKSVKAFWLNI